MNIYTLRNGVKIGPYSEVKIRDLLDTGLVTEQDLGWYDGLVDWAPLGSIAGIPSSTQSNASAPGASQGVFRIIVTISLLLLILGLAVTWMTPASTESTGSIGGNWPSGLISIGEFLLLVMWLASYVGLLLMKRWGKILFTVVVVMVLVLSIFTLSDVSTPLADVLSSLFEISVGAILALSYLTPLFKILPAPPVDAAN